MKEQKLFNENDCNQLILIGKKLATEVKLVNSFEAVKKWDFEANQIVNELKTQVSLVENEIERLREVYKIENEKHKSLSIWKRMFDANPSVKVRQKALHLKSIPAKIESVIDVLETWIERTPDTLEEAQDAIAEFKLYKKELNLEKKDLSSAARDVREYYSRKNAYTPRGKNGQFARSFNRMNKERKLGSIQEARNSIENKIRIVDETILWIEKIIHNG